MMVMPSNNSKMLVGYLAGKYPNRIGWMLSPGGWRSPHPFLPYAMDNGAYSYFKNGQPWIDKPFYDHCARMEAVEEKPLWIAVPDVVGNREETLEAWERHAPAVALFGRPLAFVVQDGMTPKDVPKEAEVIFIGGSTEWKWGSVRMWGKEFPRVHVGRVNSKRLLYLAHDAGAESFDGTGWFRGDKKQLRGLLEYLEETKDFDPMFL